MTNLKTRVGATSTGFIMTWHRDQWRDLEYTIMNFLTSLATISFSRNLRHGPISITLRDFRLTPRCKCDLRFLRMLRSAVRLITDVSGQPINPIFKGRAVQDSFRSSFKMGSSLFCHPWSSRQVMFQLRHKAASYLRWSEDGYLLRGFGFDPADSCHTFDEGILHQGFLKVPSLFPCKPLFNHCFILIYQTPLRFATTPIRPHTFSLRASAVIYVPTSHW